MSSSKMRMRVRLHRLQEIAQSLGKEPNAKEIQHKAMISDFDRYGRKQLTRLKKAKTEKLQQRANILATYGLRSRERTTVDEEFQSQIKLIDIENKNMQATLVALSDRRNGRLLDDNEKTERQQVIKLLKDSLQLLQFDFEQQTKSFEQGGGFRPAFPVGGGQQMPWGGQDDPSVTMVTDVSNVGFMNQNNQGDPMSRSNDKPRNIELAARTKQQIKEEGGQGEPTERKLSTFEQNYVTAQQKLDYLEKKHLNYDQELDDAVQWHLGDNVAQLPLGHNHGHSQPSEGTL